MDKDYVLQLEFFQDIDKKDLTPILQESEIRTYPPETVVVQQGKTQEWFFLILKGQVEIYLEEDERTHLTNLGQGEYFGEMSVLTGEFASASVVTNEDTTVLKVPRASFLELIKICPKLNSVLIQRLLVRLKQTNKGISEVSRKERNLCKYLNEEKRSCYGKFIANSPAMEQVKIQMAHLSANDSPLIILGEPGTGKEHVAAMIHYQSKRENRPFVVVNCSALTDSNWETSLLGDKRSTGQLMLAEGGSILFKHIEMIPDSAKNLLYQLLTEPSWHNRIRVMSSSNEDIEGLTSALGSELWSLLAPKMLVVPPLRDRKNDIGPLVRNFIVSQTRESGRNIINISHEAMQLLNTYSYLAGNILELEEVISRAIMIAKDETIEPENLHFGLHVPRNATPKIGIAFGGGGAKGLAHVGVLEVLEQEGIKIDYVAGTSVGAIVGGLYAAGIPTAEVKKIMSKVSWKQLVNIALPSGGIFKTDGLGHLVDKLLGQKTFDQIEKPFAVVTTDANTGQEVIIKEGLLAPAIRASATLPGIFQPICIDGKYCLDGGLVNNVPASVVRAMGANFVIAIDLGAMGEQLRHGPVQMLLQAFAIMISRNVATAAEWSDIIIKPDLSKYNISNLKYWREIMNLGRQSAIQVLPELHDKLKALQRMAI